MTEPTPNPSPVLRPAETAYPIHPLIAGRWSGRAIDPDRPVDDALLRRLLEAARWAPSAFNNQPWAYLVVTSADPEALAKARATLSKGNAWALAAPLTRKKTFRAALMAGGVSVTRRAGRSW